MTKARGKKYQELVAEVARAFDPGATVSEGVWIGGPDGRLDMDVEIRGTIDGKQTLVVIECKDFKPGSRVGRAYVDALDSKRHDLGADLAIICSNSGFSEGALNKARRKGIGMISILKQGDGRVRTEVQQEIILRRVRRVGEIKTHYYQPEGAEPMPATPRAETILFEGGSVVGWLHQRAVLAALANPENTKRIWISFPFIEPVTFDVEGRPYLITKAEIEFEYATEWLSQVVRLDAATGMYDYLRNKVRLVSCTRFGGRLPKRLLPAVHT